MNVTRLWQGLFGPPRPDEVVAKFGPQVYRHLRRIFGPRADIDDVYQNVFVEVLRSLPAFEGRAQLSTWIRRITWNVAYQEMRLHYRHRGLAELDDESQACGEPLPDERAADREELDRLYAALGELDPRQRTAVIMHDIEGRTLEQVSRELGRPLQTVASQVYAGRERLARSLRSQRSTSVSATPARRSKGEPS